MERVARGRPRRRDSDSGPGRRPLPPRVEPDRGAGRRRRLRRRGSASSSSSRRGCVRRTTPPRPCSGRCAASSTAPPRSPTAARPERVSRALREAGLRGAVHVEAFGRQTGEAARDAAAVVAARVADLDEQAGPLVQVGVSPHAPYTVGPELWAALSARLELAHSALGDASGRVAGGIAGCSHRGTDRSPSSSPAGARSRAGGRDQAAPCPGCMPAAPCGPGWSPPTACSSRRTTPHGFAQAGIAVAHCPVSNRRLRCGRLPIAALRDHGVTIGLGTDSPASAGDYDLRAEARACARRPWRHGAAPRPASSCASRPSAAPRHSGWPGRSGRSSRASARTSWRSPHPPGRAGPTRARAALDPDAAVSLVMVDGRTVMDRGGPLTLDRDAILTRAEEARSRLAR